VTARDEFRELLVASLNQRCCGRCNTWAAPCSECTADAALELLPNVRVEPCCLDPDFEGTVWVSDGSEQVRTTHIRYVLCSAPFERPGDHQDADSGPASGRSADEPRSPVSREGSDAQYRSRGVEDGAV
jgi:hypothetical protein